MRIITVAIVLSALSAIASHAQAIPDDDGFVPLFDGTTLDGWDGDFEIWTAQDGKIVGKSDGLSENVYLVTANRFQDFELRLDVLGGCRRGKFGRAVSLRTFTRFQTSLRIPG